MPRDLNLYLWNIGQAGEKVAEFTAGKSFTEFENDSMSRYAVERCFEIVGEAMNQARNLYPGLKDELREHKQIVNFRNRNIHGYFAIDEETVWSIAKVYLPGLLLDVRALLCRMDSGVAPSKSSIPVAGVQP